jgi:NAD(P)-dependent dehydrogenase (short-subunit alcohol dehydrogenase family)
MGDGRLRFVGKTVLVTGGSGGIGFHIAKHFLEEGAKVGAHYHDDRDGAERLLEMAGAGQVRLFQADFTHSEQVLGLWDEFIAWTGTIDVLVNNAGSTIKPAPLDELTEESWDSAFQVNAKAPFLLSRAAMRVMKEKSFGRIINISSIGVKFGGGPTTLAYSASKAALEAVNRSLAKEGASHNVLVNAIRAGVTDTKFHERLGRTDLVKRTQSIPLKRLAMPQEIAGVVLFLASDASSFITGSTIPVAGGE